MKITRIVSTVILLSAMLVALQIRPIQAYYGSSDLRGSNPIKDPNLSVETNRLSSRSTSDSPALEIITQTGTCHFGITAPYGVAGYDLSILGVDSYLDWSHTRTSSVAANIQYYPMTRVSDSTYERDLQALPSLLTANPGATWIIGNEPDSEVTYQDHISAETYAERFYEMAILIRLNDPTAKIAFGTIIQPTPVRLYYLTKVIDRLSQLAGDTGDSHANALALIDIYSIHAFILNEQPLYVPNCNNCWGAGVPVGYDPTTGWPAYQVIGGTQTYDINLFKEGVIAFRQWMKALGEQSKPLWITEYGSLFPTWLDVSELVTATYMEQTFNFMLGTKDPNLGYLDDDNRLVQKWFWYSLNEDVKKFGGSLYNQQNHQLTTVGDHFIKYNPPITSVPVTDPDVYIDSSSPTITPSSIIGQQPNHFNYKISIKVGNTVSNDRLTGVQVDLLLAGSVVGSVKTDLPRCAGKLQVSFNVNNLLAGESYTFTARVSPISGNGTDIDLSNNEMTFLTMVTNTNAVVTVIPQQPSATIAVVTDTPQQPSPTIAVVTDTPQQPSPTIPTMAISQPTTEVTPLNFITTPSEVSSTTNSHAVTPSSSQTSASTCLFGGGLIALILIALLAVTIKARFK